MPSYENWDDLINGMQKQVDKTLKTKVAPIVEKKLRKNAEKIAVGDFSRSNRGISDPINIVSEVNSGELLTKDIAAPQEPFWGEYDDSDNTIFSHWIDQGEWVDLNEFIKSGYKKPAPKRIARPFVTNTQNEIDKHPEFIIKALKNGLGIK